MNHLGEMTPFQKQVLDAAEAKEAEEKEKKREEMRNQHGGESMRNSRATGSPDANSSEHEQEETVRYVNKELNPDHEVHD